MARVLLDSVRKVFEGGVEAVADFSLDIGDGEFVVLVGPSGCGKSTTLRMIAGLEEITAGTIAIGERIVNDVAPKNRDIAMVFQNYALYPHMSVYKNMAFALKLRRTPRKEIDRRVRDAARMLDIGELLDRKPRQLSGGQRQRVAVGRAIVREPKAFLFDEPLSNLDARLRISTRAELKSLHQRLKTTTVYVTHDQEEAMTLGDRVVVMHRGRIQQVGTPFDVYRYPANRFVASFVGTPPMNFFDGTLDERQGELWFVEGSPRGDGDVQRLRVHGDHAPLLRAHAGKPVVLGVRPQAMMDLLTEDARALAASEGRALGVRISLVEPLGEQMDVYCSTRRHPSIVARVSASADLAPGHETVLGVETSRVRYFEPGEHGPSLLHNGAAR